MNFLKNPVVVSLIAVVAAGLVFMRVILPLMQRAGWLRPAPAAQAASGQPPRPTPVQEKKSAALDSGAPTNGRRMDAAALANNASGWKEAPRRDPFQMAVATNTIASASVVTNKEKPYPPAAQLLHLKAVYRQSGSTLAVLNDQVMSEGEDILRFTVQNIEDDRVWVSGPNGREAVNFKWLPAEAGPTPAPPINLRITQ